MLKDKRRKGERFQVSLAEVRYLQQQWLNLNVFDFHIIGAESADLRIGYMALNFSPRTQDACPLSFLSLAMLPSEHSTS